MVQVSALRAVGIAPEALRVQNASMQLQQGRRAELSHLSVQELRALLDVTQEKVCMDWVSRAGSGGRGLDLGSAGSCWCTERMWAVAWCLGRRRRGSNLDESACMR